MIMLMSSEASAETKKESQTPYQVDLDVIEPGTLSASHVYRRFQV